MQPLTPRRLNHAHSILGWALSIIALAIGVAMWRHFTSIIPSPPIAVLISSMVWILCGMIGIFYNARNSGLLSNAPSEAAPGTEEPVDRALHRLRQLQQQFDQNLITLDEYRQERLEIIEAIRASSDCG